MATTIWTLLSVFVIAPLGALAFDRPLFGNWIWHIAPEKVRDYEEHSGVTGETPHQVARAGVSTSPAESHHAPGGSPPAFSGQYARIPSAITLAA